MDLKYIVLKFGIDILISPAVITDFVKKKDSERHTIKHYKLNTYISETITLAKKDYET